MSAARSALAVLALLIATPVATAQVKEPKRADKLDIQIRYRIRADRDERIRQYRALEKHLAALGFEDALKNDPEHELDILDPTAERFIGTIPSENVLKVLDDPHVLNILFAPAGHKYPDSGDKPVAIRVILRDGLLPNQQQLLRAQVLEKLEQLGFDDALGYDTRGYTQLKGTIPYKNLPLLMKDLRLEPSGWFLPQTPPDRLPRPLADANPIRWVEVMAVTEPPPPFVPPPLLPAQAKLTPGLRAVLLTPGAQRNAAAGDRLFRIQHRGSSGAIAKPAGSRLRTNCQAGRRRQAAPGSRRATRAHGWSCAGRGDQQLRQYSIR